MNKPTLNQPIASQAWGTIYFASFLSRNHFHCAKTVEQWSWKAPATLPPLNFSLQFAALSLRCGSGLVHGCSDKR